MMQIPTYIKFSLDEHAELSFTIAIDAKKSMITTTGNGPGDSFLMGKLTSTEQQHYGRTITQ
jgi:hypothetical protein